jgi:hypothetical protein
MVLSVEQRGLICFKCLQFAEEKDSDASRSWIDAVELSAIAVRHKSGAKNNSIIRP